MRAELTQLPSVCETFAQDWDQRFSETNSASPFLSPSWIEEWLTVHSPSLRPFAFRVSELDKIVALALLVPRVRRRLGVPFRQLYLNTDGEDSADRVVVENNMLLCSLGKLPQAFRLLEECVRSHGAHEFIASGIDDTQLSCLLAAFEGWYCEAETRMGYFINLERLRQEGDLLPLVSSNTRAQIRKALRRCDQHGPIVVEVAGTSGQAAEFLEELMELHAQRWSAIGEPGAFASPARRAFHRGFVMRGAQRSEAVLIRVRNGDATLGVLYFLAAHGKVNFYQSGLSQLGDPQRKPGFICHYLACRYFAERGYREYDFLSSPASEARYKQSLSTDRRSLHWVHLARPTMRNSLLKLVRSFR